MNITKSEHPEKTSLNVTNYLPHVIKKRINKTSEGRSGDHIYKRRNNRSYRVLIQYSSWLAMKTDKAPNLLNKYDESYIVSISPEEYFGDNYPNRSPNLHKDFVLNQTGFIYYTNINQFNKYTPTIKKFSDWIELVELSTEPLKTYKSWVGEYALNIRNTSSEKISTICSSGTINSKKKKEIKKRVKDKLINDGVKISTELKHAINNLPEQKGIGNYDYDYASKSMIKDVKRQMLSLMFLARSRDGLNLPEYIKKNYKLFEHKKDTKTFRNNLANDSYVDNFNNIITDYISYCENNGLLDYKKLIEIGVLKPSKKIICPLCLNEIFIDDFFSKIDQVEGRISSANTQREVVLMHIEALQPLKLNHKIYNLGWGHNYCNLIQGDKSIEETIDIIEKIIMNHEKK